MAPDAQLISVGFGGDSLKELRQVLYATDQEFFGGVAPRIHPMIDLQQAVGLLSSVGFIRPVGDRDQFGVDYSHLTTLIHDLRDMGETSAMSAGNTPTISRDYWPRAEAIYLENFGHDKKLEATFELIWISGWTADKINP